MHLLCIPSIIVKCAARLFESCIGTAVKMMQPWHLGGTW